MKRAADAARFILTLETTEIFTPEFVFVVNYDKINEKITVNHCICCIVFIEKLCYNEFNNYTGELRLSV